MKMNFTSVRSLCGLSLIALVIACAGTATAGSLNVTPTNDFDGTVDGSAIYTHSVNIGDGDVVVNGVLFGEYTVTNDFGSTEGPSTDATTGLGYNVTGPDNFIVKNFPNDPHNISDSSVGFVPGFLAAGRGGDGTYTLTLDGLSAGRPYELTMYFIEWNNTDRTVDFIEDGVGVQGSFNADGDVSNGREGTVLTYGYVAQGSTQSFTIDGEPNALPHFHAFSNVVVPEPAGVALGAVGLLLASIAMRVRHA